MAIIPSLGKLERVDPKVVWSHEAHSFTPWLALPENLTQLGETLGVELELEAVEQAVGPFRADILCKQVGSGHWILIENQLEKTDHPHLGQVLTYAAGLDAVTIVWISPQFTDEHRACLDWLNRSTLEGLNFFGVQLEVWRIGESQHAPRFNIVSKPNQWTKSVSSASATISEIGTKHLEFWTAFAERLKMKNGPLKVGKPGAQNYMTLSPFGRNGFCLSVATNIYEAKVRAGLYITLKNSDAYYKALLTMKDEIEAKLGQVTWHDRATQERAVLLILDGANSLDADEWPTLHEWLIEKLYALFTVFAPIVKSLQPVPDEGPA